MAAGPRVLYEFGPFRVDPDKQVLLREDEPIPITAKAFETLLILVRHSREVVSKDELMKTVWPDTFVEEGNLSQNIFILRKALGDTPEDRRYIVTLPGRGYRFTAQVRTVTQDGEDLVIQSRSRSQMVIEQTDSTPRDQGVRRKTESAGSGQPSPINALSAKRENLIARTWKLVLAASFVVIAMVGGVFFYFGAPALSKKDTIVIADFDNRTGDPVFDDTLKQALAVQLEQSPFLNLLSDQKVNATLRLMGRSPSDRLTANIAQDLCQRAGSKAVLAGSIDRLGSQYVIGLRALNCASGDPLSREQVQAAAKEEVLRSLSTAAKNIRNKLGEELATIQKFDTPVEQATTPSLEALQAYSLGLKTWNMKGETAALPFFQRAVELDPDFAMAYARLGSAYRNLDEPTLSAANLGKAFALREKASERERLYIEARYYRWVTGEVEKWAQVCELWKQIYPQDRLPHNDLAHVYSNFGKYDKSLEEAREALQLEPNTAANYLNLASYYFSLNRLDEAEAVLREAKDRKLQSRDLLDARYQLAFLKNDAAEMKRLGEQAVGQPGVEDMLLAEQADMETYHGRLTKGRQLRRRAVESAKDNGATEAAAGYLADAGLEEAYLGQLKQARADADEAMALAPNRVVQVEAALALALVGDITRAERLADELNKSFPVATSVQRYWLPTIRAALALEGKNPDKAIDVLQVTIPYELAPYNRRYGSLCPVYLSGQAYLKLHNGSAAAAEFQKIIDHRGIVVATFAIGALAHLGLARAYVLQRDTEKARAAYQDYLTLWKDADPDIPILKEAKAEYEKVK